MKLVVIEGAGKKESIQKYLGREYEVFATKGHIRDLPARTLAVDVEKNFAPKYDIMPDKKEIVKSLKAKAEKADEILLATDPDREGEAISWHIANIIGMDEKQKARVSFNEISKSAVSKAIASPREIDLNLVNAQQARRVLDRLVGYKLSPYLNKKISGAKLSAGRVQSATLKIIVDRENEIRNFKPEEFWNIFIHLNKLNDKQPFKALFWGKNGKKLKVLDKEQAEKILSEVEANKQNIFVKSVKESVAKSSPGAPFITSTMQQEALNKLGMTLKRTSLAAQSLYEGVNIKGEHFALITYIRTDSYRISSEAAKMAEDYIKAKYGENYLPKTRNIFKNKKNMQDAHEAIRPIDLDMTPEKIKGSATSDQYKLYKLIYERFLASQMAEATFNSLNAEISAGENIFKVNGKTPIFDGFLKAYNYVSEKEENNEEENENDSKLPKLAENDKLSLIKTSSEQKFTKAPARFTEASLVKVMEDRGIGRPATYVPTVGLLFARLYVEKEQKYIKPTKLGELAVEVLGKNFDNVLNTEFTANMEDRLDDVEEGNVIWQNLVGEFYEDLVKRLKDAGEDMTKIKIEAEPTDEICDKCGKPMVIRTGRYGKFIACTGYPECKNIKNVKKVVAKCPKCQGEVSEKKSKKGKLFYGCDFYPKCDYISWNIPTGDKCPKCKDFLVFKETKTEKRIFCPSKECDYVKVENLKTDKE